MSCRDPLHFGTVCQREEGRSTCSPSQHHLHFQVLPLGSQILHPIHLGSGRSQNLALGLPGAGAVSASVGVNRGWRSPALTQGGGWQQRRLEVLEGETTARLAEQLSDQKADEFVQTWEDTNLRSTTVFPLDH